MAVQMNSTVTSAQGQNSDKKFVIVETAEYGKRIGTLEFICASPYHGETIQRAFVVALAGDPFWTEYAPVADLVYVTTPQPETPEVELENDPEYQQFLLDSEVAEMALEQAEQVQEARPVPTWAAEGAEMVQGCELKAGDTVYFSEKANPRYLKSNLGAGAWKCVTLADSFGFQKRIPSTCSIDLNRWYVVKRKRELAHA